MVECSIYVLGCIAQLCLQRQLEDCTRHGHTCLASCNVHELHSLDQCDKQVGILEVHFRISRLMVPKAFCICSVMLSEAWLLVSSTPLIPSGNTSTSGGPTHKNSNTFSRSHLSLQEQNTPPQNLYVSIWKCIVKRPLILISFCRWHGCDHKLTDY